MRMNKITTLNQFQEIQQEEKALQALLFEEYSDDCKPRQSTINNILNYSKALSVRKNEYLGQVEMVLN